MESLFGLLLVAIVSNGVGDGQHVAGVKVDAQAGAGEHSLVNSALNSVSALAKVVTPVSGSDSASDARDEQVPAAVVWVHLSKQYLSDYVERSVDHKKPARENVLGILFTGDSRTMGKTTLVLRPSDRQAVADVNFTGTVRSNTVGHSGPATLQYIGESTFHARKQLVVGTDGVSATQAVVEAPTRLIPTSVATNLPGLRGRIGNRIAQRREAGSRGQAEMIVGRDTANDIRHDFDTKLGGALADIQSKVKTQIAALKLNGEDGDVVMRSRSTPEFVEVALCPQSSKASDLQMAADSPFDGNPECSVCVHRSIVGSLMANSELREKLAPMLTSVIGATAGPKLSMSGEWVALDLAGAQTAQAPSRVAATQSLTSR